jgi:hypothetical protein
MSDKRWVLGSCNGWCSKETETVYKHFKVPSTVEGAVINNDPTLSDESKVGKLEDFIRVKVQKILQSTWGYSAFMRDLINEDMINYNEIATKVMADVKEEVRLQALKDTE